MTNIEDIYNKALEALKQGYSKEQILAQFSEHKVELEPLLTMSSRLFSVPKSPAPHPAMQRKYIAASGRHMWLAWLKISRFTSVSVSMTLILAALTGTGYAAFQSGPGQTLFAIKKSAEQAQVLLASDTQAKANLQVAIAQQRLNEAQQIFSNPASDPQEKAAALAELSAQTSTAVAQVSTAAQKDPASSASQPLINSLQNLSDQQRNLLAKIQPDTQIQQAKSSALASLDQASQKIDQIKQYVAIADSDQSLTKLTADPNSVAVFGTINKIDQNQITVEKTTFTLNSQTSISDTNGSTLTVSDLSQGTKVNIVGVQDQNTLVAQKVLVTSNNIASSSSTASSTASGTPGEVKGASTTATNTISAIGTNHSSTNTDQTLKQVLENDLKNNHQDNFSTSSQSDNSGTAVGSFILEDPNPQFIGN